MTAPAHFSFSTADIGCSLLSATTYLIIVTKHSLGVGHRGVIPLYHLSFSVPPTRSLFMSIFIDTQLHFTYMINKNFMLLFISWFLVAITHFISLRNVIPIIPIKKNTSCHVKVKSNGMVYCLH